MARHKDFNWSMPAGDSEGRHLWDSVKISVLMDIRDQLQKLNGLLHCSNFVAIPSRLSAIKRAIVARRPLIRVCTKCRGQIVRGDKWFRAKRGYQHRDCKEPDGYGRRRKP